MKSAVYSWRLSATLKDDLETVARRQHRSVAEVLDEAVRAWLNHSSEGDPEGSEARLRAAAMACVGTLESGDPDRSTNVRRTLRAKLQARHGR